MLCEGTRCLVRETPQSERIANYLENESHVKLNLGELSAQELKTLYVAVKNERERRGKRNPANHIPEEWAIPNDAIAR